MTQEQYYTAPPDHIFEEIKKASIEIWKGYEDDYGYATSKINAIKDIGNVKDNAWYMVAMFDPINMVKLIANVSKETGEMILDAMRT